MGMPGGIGQAATEGAEAAEEAGGDRPVAPPGRCPGRQQTCTCAGKHAFQPAHTLPHFFGTPSAVTVIPRSHALVPGGDA